ncbi:MAG: hypothetical protein KAV44_07555 [Bacteroidales bacterium]|nr:hypothetical protein [Bacteroidales bacterium]
MNILRLQNFYTILSPFIKIANKINWRFGRHFKCKNHLLYPVGHLIGPGMIILSHKKFELTNFFIKGYWTHVAVIVSSEFVVEATSKGVMKTKFKEFIFTVDDFVILKPLFCDTNNMKEASKYVQKVIGSPYNFSFRPCEDTFYCSELVYWAYTKSCEWYDVRNKIPQGINDFIKGNIIKPQSMFESIQMWSVVQAT